MQSLNRMAHRREGEQEKGTAIRRRNATDRCCVKGRTKESVGFIRFWMDPETIAVWKKVRHQWCLKTPKTLRMSGISCDFLEFLQFNAPGRHLSGRTAFINIKHFNFSKKMSEGSAGCTGSRVWTGQIRQTIRHFQDTPLPAVFS